MRKLLNVFDRVHVVHDPGGRTFHPKLYLVEGPARATLLVGSSNATAGGLYFNFEASLEAIFELSHAPDREAGQGNVPTVLHWGPQLNALLRATDCSGHIVRIERLDDGSFAFKSRPESTAAAPPSGSGTQGFGVARRVRPDLLSLALGLAHASAETATYRRRGGRGVRPRAYRPGRR
jgi:hypothetical protein